ncbi:MAG: TIGR00296 family protein [Candidatus Aenigmatarchaeota archaeon]
MNLKDGEFAVKLARKAIEEWVKKGEKIDRPKNFDKKFLEKAGVFVTIHTYPEKLLRGCIGFPYPSFPLIDAIIEAAISSTQDPRFPPLDPSELNKIIVEVSILTPPKRIVVKKPEDYLKKIVIGRDGLIIKKGFNSGLLLPQVAIEYGWDVKTFLEHLCDKAFLPRDAWLSKDAQIFSFKAEIFGEREPSGKIERHSD